MRNGQIDGFLAGAEASYAGLAYRSNSAPTAGVAVNGIIAFNKAP